MKAILPVAGGGTRMYPLGVTTPKCLIPILNKPLVIWSLENLAENKIYEVVVIISAGKFGQKIRDYLEKNLKNYPKLNKTKIEFAVQEQQLGTAHVLQMAKDHIKKGDEFVFLYGDDLYGPKNIANVLKAKGLAVTGMKVEDPEKWGIFQTDKEGTLLKVVEKSEEHVGNLANIGCMKLDSTVFDIFDELKISKRGEYELTDSLQILAQQDKVKVVESTDYWIPIGYPWHVLEAAEYFLPDLKSKIEGKVEDNVTIKGNVVLPKSSQILAGTYIYGNVVVGENTIIGPNAYIRKSAVIGDNCRIGFGVLVKNSVIGNNSTVDHLAYLGDSVLGTGVSIGGNSTVANLRHDQTPVKTAVKGELVSTMRRKFGTVIGDNAKIAIGNNIYPGRKIWPDKTTRPGEIIDKDLVE